MKMVLPVWIAHLRSAYSALRQDARTRVAWLIALTFDGAAGFWSIHQLLNWASQWQAAGSPVLDAHLWLLCLGAWGVILRLFPLIRKPIIEIFLVDYCRKRHRNHIVITPLGVRSFVKRLERDTCQCLDLYCDLTGVRSWSGVS